MNLVTADVKEPKFRKTKVMYGVEAKKNGHVLGRFEDPPTAFKYLIDECELPLSLFCSGSSEENGKTVFTVWTWEDVDFRFCWEGDIYEVDIYRKELGEQS